MSTAAQLAQYCVDHGFTLKTQGKHMNSYLIPGTLTFDVIIAAVAYTVGRVGITYLWSDLTSIFSWIKSRVSSTPVTPTPVVTPTAA